MALIEAALAFAITMLALSLVCSTFVELVHRLLSMREAGLQYMLGQMFDQVLTRYIAPELNTAVQADANIAAAEKDPRVQQLLAAAREEFVKCMSANRAPMGVTPKATLTGPKASEATSIFAFWKWPLWNGRDLASMTPAQFMERLGSLDLGIVVNGATTIDVAKAVRDANSAGNATAITAAVAAAPAGASAIVTAVTHLAARDLANATDGVLKDVAQKFDAFGKEAGSYFEGRARLLSVVVAIVVAFAMHVDAIDLFRTYLRDPNARAKVIEQSQAVTAQYKSAQDAADALKKLVPDANAATADVKAEVAQLQKDWSKAIEGAKTSVTEYADLGTPVGWTPERIANAEFSHWIWFCAANRPDGQVRFWAPDCERKDRTVVFAIPSVPSLLLYLLIGGLLIGLGAPFWYDVVTGLTSIRSAATGQTGAPAPQPGAVAAAAPTPQATNAQPVTPVGVFQISSAAIVS